MTHRPVPFQGTDEERQANYATHSFVYYDDEAECMGCCCKPWHTAASYPCGQEPERETVDDEVATSEQMARFAAYALSQ